MGAPVPETVAVITMNKERFDAPIVCFADTGVFLSSERELPFRSAVELHFSSVRQLPVAAEVVMSGSAGLGLELPQKAPLAIRRIFEHWSHGESAATSDLNEVLPAPARTPPPRRSLKTDVRPEVLVIDDDLAICEMLKRALTHMDCNVHVARGAFEGMEMLSRHKIDAVLLDWLMPKASGEVVLDTMKSTKHRARVAVMSAVATSPEARQKMRALGAETVFSKPFQIGRIVRWIKG